MSGITREFFICFPDIQIDGIDGTDKDILYELAVADELFAFVADHQLDPARVRRSQSDFVARENDFPGSISSCRAVKTLGGSCK
jgi:hypothetical protein